jgi:CubicO group peptidase (beta-lactamase class C family)
MRLPILFLVLTSLLTAQLLPTSTPEKEGLSTARLKRLHDRYNQFVQEGSRAGAITLVARNGKVVDWQAYGYRDVERKLPMEKDTICRIWSMTKVVTSVAAMMLVEEGKIALNDPVSKYIPQFKEMRVLTGGTADNPETVPAVRPVTVKHLFTHTSGNTYPSGGTPVAELNRRAEVFSAPTLKEFAEKVAGLPLIAQPGEKYNYGINIDLLGYVVEVASGMPFDKFVQTRILDPLKMTDTSFVMPQDKLNRLAKTYSYKDGKLTEFVTKTLAHNPTVPFGGMGLYSTIADYSRFGQMLLNGGELNGIRFLGRKTVELMEANHLGSIKVPYIDPNGAFGFGLGGSVRIDIGKGHIPGSLGQFGWDGAASTYFRIDPTEKLMTILFQQYMPFDSANLELFSTLVYQSIVD